MCNAISTVIVSSISLQIASCRHRTLQFSPRHVRVQPLVSSRIRSVPWCCHPAAIALHSLIHSFVDRNKMGTCYAIIVLSILSLVYLLLYALHIWVLASVLADLGRPDLHRPTLSSSALDSTFGHELRLLLRCSPLLLLLLWRCWCCLRQRSVRSSITQGCIPLPCLRKVVQVALAVIVETWHCPNHSHDHEDGERRQNPKSQPFPSPL